VIGMSLLRRIVSVVPASCQLAVYLSGVLLLVVLVHTFVYHNRAKAKDTDVL
jgi:hypothetical protein